jgi:hypothetical protein
MSEVPQLGITCGSTNCGEGKHAFNSPSRTYKRRGQGRKFLAPGVCKGCGKTLVDWPRVHARDSSDAEYTFASLRHEYIRWEFWTRPFNDRSRLDVKQRGAQAVYADIHPTLTRILRPPSVAHYMNMQVPLDQEKMQTVIQYGQHAVAACCRKCVETWHGIPNSRDLTESEIQYLAVLLRKFLDQRLLEERGE